MNIKDKEKVLQQQAHQLGNLTENLPPVRQVVHATMSAAAKPQSGSTTKQIKSCDYRQWDKYDAGKALVTY